MKFSYASASTVKIFSKDYVLSVINNNCDRFKILF